MIDLSQKEEIVVAQLMDALTSIGFCTLVHHGVDNACFEKAFAASKSFFDLATPIKTQYKFQGHDSNRGYLSMACETHDQTPNTQPDAKETLDIGKEDEPGYQNEWPEELQDTSFRNDLLVYFRTMDGLFLKLMKWIGIGLKMPDPERLVQACNGQHENLRLLHYPASTTSSSASSSSFRSNVHTDFGALTLLSQDQVGGLRVQNLDGTWITVTPVPNAIVLNVGDMLMRWSNDIFKATPHHVVTPSKYDGTTPERYSMAFFCNANKETMIECLETCCESSSPAKYPPISSHEYLTKRLVDTIHSDKQANM